MLLTIGGLIRLFGGEVGWGYIFLFKKIHAYSDQPHSRFPTHILVYFVKSVSSAGPRALC